MRASGGNCPLSRRERARVRASGGNCPLSRRERARVRVAGGNCPLSRRERARVRAAARPVASSLPRHPSRGGGALLVGCGIGRYTAGGSGEAGIRATAAELSLGTVHRSQSPASAGVTKGAIVMSRGEETVIETCGGTKMGEASIIAAALDAHTLADAERVQEMIERAIGARHRRPLADMPNNQGLASTTGSFDHKIPRERHQHAGRGA